MIPFSMNIINFDKESSSYTVEYVPEDISNYDSITFNIYIDFVNKPNITKEEIIEILSKSSPQHYWETKARIKTLDATFAKSLVQQKITTEKTAEIMANYNPSSLVETTNPELQSSTTANVEEFIQSILNEQQSG